MEHLKGWEQVGKSYEDTLNGKNCKVCNSLGVHQVDASLQVLGKDAGRGDEESVGVHKRFFRV